MSLHLLPKDKPINGLWFRQHSQPHCDNPFQWRSGCPVFGKSEHDESDSFYSDANGSETPKAIQITLIGAPSVLNTIPMRQFQMSNASVPAGQTLKLHIADGGQALHIENGASAMTFGMSACKPPMSKRLWLRFNGIQCQHRRQTGSFVRAYGLAVLPY